MASFSRLSLVILSIYLLTPILATDSSELCDGLGWAPTKPFNPWFRAWTNLTSGPGGDDPDFVNNMACWWYADCIFNHVPETRKQQYGAISIVMALIPLILKDIAWPEKRIVLIANKSGWVIEIIVRALGLNPTIPEDQTQIKQGRLFHPIISAAVLVLLVAFLLVSYGLLAVMEVYSKRSSLGCPVPAFVVLWFIIALAPAAVEVAIGRFRNRNKSVKGVSSGQKGFPAGEVGTSGKSTVMVSPDEETLSGINGHSRSTVAVPGSSNGNHRQSVISTARVSNNIQGGEQHWMAQFCWGLYYSAGGLIFTSIMLVAVVELFTWMLLAGVASAASKMLGYRLCGYWGPKGKMR
ncbi:hypothetical protein DL95DRAFT_518525 [Leptodontidium sp. 2 PMI_412]|nr:hypothetical protein DL95DRAFT_518525 [Leptodontidium sp. 2 PMI_412]